MSDFIPDAVMVPLNYSGPGDAASRLGKLQSEFSAVLRVPRVHVRHQGSAHFLSGAPPIPCCSPNPTSVPGVRATTGRREAMGCPMGGIGPMRDLVEHQRRKPGARGRLARLSDGHPWLLAEVEYRPASARLTSPVVDSELDRFYEQVILGEDVPLVDILAVARTLLLANYELEECEVADLLSVAAGDEAEALAGVVLESVFGPDRKVRGYVDWARASLLANGLALSSIPASSINDVLAILVATKRTVPSSQFVDACRAARDRDSLEHLV